MIERILVPLDGSILADRTLLQVRKVLLAKDAEVFLLRVIEAAPAPRPKAVDEMERGFAETHLADQCRRLLEQGARATSRIVDGDPAAEILRAAEEYSPSLIAMSTHGRTGLDRWIWGSVAERVLREARHPLLLSNPRALSEETQAVEGRFARILIPLDGSENSSAILPLVQGLARLYESEVTLFYAQPVVVASLQYPAVPFTPTKEDGQKLLAPYRDRFAAAGVRTTVEVSFEGPAQAILDAATAGKADLVAMTTHGRSGFARWAFGSVAEKVVRHCPCPVMVQRVRANRE